MTTYTMTELRKTAAYARAEIRAQYPKHRVYFDEPMVRIPKDGHAALVVPYGAYPIVAGAPDPSGEIRNEHNIAI